jgi:hypothetical protein
MIPSPSPTPTRWILLASALCALALAGCGDSGGSDIDAPPGGDIDASGGGDDAPPIDALIPADCVPGGTQCTDCVDNDSDGHADGYDVECTGAADDDEGDFATGIPGDNIDTVKQDCFFDGNSGSGDDGCEIHVCCLLGAPDAESCPFGPGQYDPAECDDAQSANCIDNCVGLTPAGCDCFGCCTMCDAATDECRDIITNPATAPDCDDDSILDPVACPSCVKVDACENPCDPAQCILCPGQDPSDLPPGCDGEISCADGAPTCTDGACPAGSYCSNGCCIGSIE